MIADLMCYKVLVMFVWQNSQFLLTTFVHAIKLCLTQRLQLQCNQAHSHYIQNLTHANSCCFLIQGPEFRHKSKIFSHLQLYWKLYEVFLGKLY